VVEEVRRRPAWGLLLALAAAKVLVHAALAGRYGWFRDELYFLDCGRHLDWGYVDHAPLVGLMARLGLLLGGSLVVFRLMAALAGAALVVMAGLLAFRLGGGRFAQGLAALAVLVVPVNLSIGGLFSMNVFEPLFWMGALLVLLRLLETGERRLWLLVGLILGVGLLNKHSTAFFGLALFAGLLLSPARRELRTPWPWLGAGVALLVFAPNLVWQAVNGFPTLEDLRNVARTGKNVVLGPVDFAVQQALMVHPVLLPLWLGGLVAALRAPRPAWRLVGFTYVVFYVLLFALHAKPYYLAPIYPALLATGAVALEAWPPAARPALRAAVVAVVAVFGAITAPLVLPLLPPEKFVAYQQALGVRSAKTEVAHEGPLPQRFGDQFGWPELVAEVARIHAALPEPERRVATIFAGNYGEAGAVNLFGPAYGLPTAISGHQTHFLWGPRGARGDVIIVLQGDPEVLARLCTSYEEAGRHHHRWGMAEENRPIHVCRGLRMPLEELWPRVKHWN
jgi:4-amino-4-deoxy-L-arabinose transferase-like glycosyltransferase